MLGMFGKQFSLRAVSQVFKKETLWGGLLACLAVGYILWYIAIYVQFPSDDAYIHMRIARNFVEQGTPYFNPDQAVAGSSSVFWLLLLTGVFHLFGSNPQIVPVITSVFTIGLFAACIFILSYRYRPLVSVSLSIFVVFITVLNVAALMMETPAALLFWLLSIIYLRRDALIGAGLCAGLAFATRYEFVVWLLLIILIPKETKSRLRLGLGETFPIISVLLFNIYFFGALIPNTVRAKSIIYTLSMNDPLLQAHLYTGVPIFLALFILHILLAIFLFKWRGQRLTAVMLGFGAIILALYVLRKTLLFAWYIPIFLFPLTLSYSLLYSNIKMYARIAVVSIALLFVWYPMARTFVEARGLLFNELRHYRDYATGLRVKQYLNIGSHLARNYPHASLMTSEIGGLGWTFPGKIIDAAGLVSPECLKYHPLRVPQDRSFGSIGAIPPNAVLDLRPDLIVTMETFSVAVRRDMATMRISEYRLLANYPTLAPDASIIRSNMTLWGSKWTQVFIRKQLLDLGREPTGRFLKY